MDISTPGEVEQYLVTRSAELTAPLERECVLCFVNRMLDAFGCDTTLRWARRWRDVRAPRATGLERRLRARGGFCDCEVFSNGWALRDGLLVEDENADLVWPEQRPRCAGVRARSSQPCTNWVTWRRPRW